MDNRNQNPHFNHQPQAKIGAADWVNASKPLLSHQPKRAQQLISAGLKLDPGLAAAYFNLGLALHQQARIPAAIRAYRLALLEADSGPQSCLVQQSATRNLAQDLLLNGCFREGWRCYEERLEPGMHTFFEELAGPP